MSSLSRVQFVGKDFDTFFSEITQEATTNFGDDANDFTTSNLGTMLIDLVSFGLDTLAFYLDLQAGESFIQTALLDESIVKIARQLGFKVKGSVPASTDLNFVLAQVEIFDVPIQKGFQFTGGGLIWEVVTKTTVLAGATTATFTVREGVTVEERFISDGSKNQVFQLGQVPADTVIAQGSEEVFVDNESYEVVDFMEFRADKIVEIQPRTNPPQAIFGDDVAGTIPPTGAEIRVRYIATHGPTGNDVESGAISTSGPLVVNGQTIAFTVTNPDKPTGGSLGKTIEEVRRLAPEVFRSQDSAVTTRDIIALSESFSDPSFGAVSKASAISLRDATIDDTLDTILTALQSAITANQYTTELATLSTIQGAFSGTERDDILASLATIESNVDLQDPDFVTALASEDDFANAFNAIKRENGFNIDAQLATITTVAHSSLKNTVNVAVQFRIATATAASGETFPGTLPIPAGSRIVPGSLTVRKNGTGSPGSGTSMGTDNGDGTITGGSLTSSTIDYFTGVISITEVGDAFTASDTVDIDFQTFTSDEADVLAAAGAIQQLVTTVQTNILAEVTTAEAVLAQLILLLELMRARGVTDIKDEIAVIRAVMNTLSPTFQTDFASAVTDITTGVAAVNVTLAQVKSDTFDHVDDILSNDCKTNVVQVGILTLDQNGFFAGASTGLTNALQVFLDARKEPTVTIKTISGDGFLIAADITVQISVSDILIVEDIRSEVETVVDTLLKGRDFGIDLRLSQIYTPVAAVSGVSFAHVTITGPIPNIDVNGDLVVSGEFIITKGTVTVTVI